jgi:Na+/proline symporter
MVQRMLTATDYKKSRLSLITSGLADIPIGFIFLTIGILLHLYFQQVHDPALPHKNNEIFAYFILKQMPVGLRGLLVAGIFATAMGSLSAALNALATSATRDFYKGGNGEGDGEKSVSVARKFTFMFAGLMIVIASITAYFVITHPSSRVIPIVLGIFGYTYGSLLGVFLLGMLTKTRGNDFGNYVAMVCGFILVSLISGLPNQIVELAGGKPLEFFSSIPEVEFPWRIMFGSLTTLGVGLLFSKKQESDSAQEAPASAGN